MALPRINDVPMYTMTVPSTGKEVKFRPFLVKEQKVLLIAYETQDRKQIINSVIDCIHSCVDNQVEVNKLPIFDVDYIFTQIRSKSVGEKAELNLRCENCNETTPFTIDLSEIEPPKLNEVKKDLIEINESIKIKMKYPSYTDVMQNVNSESDEDFSVRFIISCIDLIQTEEESIIFRDEPLEERIKFVESLTNEQFEKLSSFISNIPKLAQEVSISCDKCGTETKRTLEGMENFF